jgi:hypothetical protein
VSADAYSCVEEVLLLLPESRERAESTAVVARASGLGHVAAALADTDRELLALHRRLYERVYLRPAESSQLTLQS